MTDVNAALDIDKDTNALAERPPAMIAVSCLPGTPRSKSGKPATVPEGQLPSVAINRAMCPGTAAAGMMSAFLTFTFSVAATDVLANGMRTVSGRGGTITVSYIDVGGVVGLSVAVAVVAAVGVCVGVRVDVDVSVAVGLGVDVAVTVAVTVGVDVFVAVGVSVDVGVAVGVGDIVGVNVTVPVLVWVGVIVKVRVMVRVGVGPEAVGVHVTVGVGVLQGGLNTWTQPTTASHKSIVQSLLSSQFSIRQKLVQPSQFTGGPLVSQVSGYSTTPLPQLGHGARQPAGSFGPTQVGRTSNVAAGCTVPVPAGGFSLRW